MPSGIYKRTEEHKKQTRKNFAKGREPEARKKAKAALRKNAESMEWREKVRAAVKVAMHRPEVRERHLAGLKKYAKEHGYGFKGGNGQPSYGLIIQVASVLIALGFDQECVIKTKGHRTGEKSPDNYKVDFGNPRRKIAIEYDGPCHANFRQRKIDAKKNRVLEALGWIVLRINHR